MGMDAALMRMMERLDRLERQAERRSLERSLDTVLDARAYGARPGATATVNTVALQAAVDDAIAAGGGRIYIRGTPDGEYIDINAAITIQPGSSTVPVEIFGDGRASTIIRQTTVGADTIVIGETGAQGADDIRINHLGIKGGRHSIRANNTLFLELEWVGTDSPSGAGLYFEGQNEHAVIRNCHLHGGQYGIITGQLNGGDGTPELDLPEFQKFRIEKCRISQAETAAIKLTAGSLTGQQVTGFGSISDIVLENCFRDGIDITYGSNIVLEAIYSESAIPGVLQAANTYSIIRLGTGCQGITIRRAYLFNLNGDGVTRYKYAIEQVAGTLTVQDCVLGVGGAAATADLRLGDYASVSHTSVTSLSQLTAADWSKVNLDHIRDSTAALIVGATRGQDPNAAPNGFRGNTRIGHATADVEMDLDPGSASGQGLVVWQRSGATKWYAGMTAAGTPAFVIANTLGGGNAISIASGGAVAVAGSLAIGGGTAITKHLSATATWDPGNLPNNTATTTTVTVTGAALGDTAVASFSLAVNGGAIMHAHVTSANTVTVTFINHTGADLNLASGTVRVDVWQH